MKNSCVEFPFCHSMNEWMHRHPTPYLRASNSRSMSRPARRLAPNDSLVRYAFIWKLLYCYRLDVIAPSPRRICAKPQIIDDDEQVDSSHWVTQNINHIKQLMPWAPRQRNTLSSTEAPIYENWQFHCEPETIMITRNPIRCSIFFTDRTKMRWNINLTNWCQWVFGPRHHLRTVHTLHISFDTKHPNACAAPVSVDTSNVTYQKTNGATDKIRSHNPDINNGHCTCHYNLSLMYGDCQTLTHTMASQNLVLHVYTRAIHISRGSGKHYLNLWKVWSQPNLRWTIRHDTRTHTNTIRSILE